MKISSQPIRVQLVDDQEILRDALLSFLSTQDGFEVIREEGGARTALEYVSLLRPDVVVLRITTAGSNGLDAISRLRDFSPHTQVVVLTDHEDQFPVDQAMQVGAAGYLFKDSNPGELVQAIQAVHRGDTYISPRVHTVLGTGTRNGAAASNDQMAALTPREREVFKLLALGNSNKDVASKLEMSVGTAKKHRENLKRKLHVRSSAEFALLAIHEGLLDR